MRSNLPLHLRLKHKWSDEKAKKVNQTHNLRKKYTWQSDEPIRTKPQKKKREIAEVTTEKVKSKDYHVRKWCPQDGCLSTTLNMSVHLKGHHQMDVGPEYYEALKRARVFIQYTTEERQRVRASLQRDYKRKVMLGDSQSRMNEQEPDYEREVMLVDSQNRMNEQEDVDFEEIDFRPPWSHNENNVDHMMSKFLVYLLSPDGGKRERKSSLQTVKEVRTIANVLDNKIENLLDRHQVRDKFFRDHFDKIRKAGTSKHYMSSLISFLEFLISESIQLEGLTTDDYTSMKLRLYNWRKSYNKEIELQKWVTEEEQLEVLITPEQLATFENGEMARSAIKLFGQVS